jgi:hypothetical protein
VTGRELGADERAVVDLIVNRGLDYGAIAGVTGVSESDVRARARRALAALGGSDPGDAVTAYLLGAGETAERAKAEAALSTDPASAALMRKIAAGLEDAWPQYTPPAIPADAGSSRRLLAVGAAGALAAGAVVAILALAGVFGGDDHNGTRTKSTTLPPPVTVDLAPPNGGVARGIATIGLTRAFRPYMQLDFEQLQPPPQGAVYLLWVDSGNGHGFPLPTPIETSANGGFHQRYTLSPALAPLLRLGRSLDLIAVGADQLAALSQAVSAGTGKQGRQLPARPGAVVLEGKIP